MEGKWVGCGLRNCWRQTGMWACGGCVGALLAEEQFHACASLRVRRTEGTVCVRRGEAVCVVVVRGLSLPSVCTRAPASGCWCRGLRGGCSAPSITLSALSWADMAVSRAPRLADLILFISARAEPARAGSLKAPSITGGGGTGGP